MVKHIVIWKLHEFAERMNKKENALRMKQWLKDLKARIPEIQNLEVGIHFKDSDDAFDIILNSEFKDRISLHTYQNHPAHVRFKEKIRNLRSEKKVIDYEI